MFHVTISSGLLAPRPGTLILVGPPCYVPAMARQTAVPEGAGFAYDVGIRAIDEQLRRIEAFDTKAGILIAADGVLVGLLAADTSLLPLLPRIPVAIGLSLVLSSLALALVAFGIRRYRIGPSLSASIRLMAASAEWLRWRFLGDLERSVTANDARLRWKSRFLSGAMLSLLTAILLLGGYAVLAVIGGA